MSEEEARGWRAWPPLLQLALAVWLVELLARLVPVSHGIDASVRWQLALSGMYFGSVVLFTAGLLELARRLAGRERKGVRIAGFVQIAVIVASAVWHWASMLYRGEHFELVFDVGLIVTVALSVAVAIGLAVAAWPRRALAIPGLALAVVANAAHVFEGKIMSWLGSGIDGY
jgi:hypothetical protein